MLSDVTLIRDLRLALRMIFYRRLKVRREISNQGSLSILHTQENADASLEEWFIRDSSEAVFDGETLSHHFDELPEDQREGMRQQAQNLRWFAAQGAEVALSDSDEQLARLFAISQNNAVTILDPASLQALGTTLERWLRHVGDILNVVTG